MSKYLQLPVEVKAIQWNVPKLTKSSSGGEFLRPMLARECFDHPLVMPTDYMEVANLLKTSGCSREEPYWNWSVLGVLATDRGIVVVYPGDWIVTRNGKSFSISNEDFHNYFKVME